jgi:hypothetical protein
MLIVEHYYEPLTFQPGTPTRQPPACLRIGGISTGRAQPIPVCRKCGAPVGIFLDHGLRWQHFRCDDGTSGTQEVYDPGHPAQVGWLLPGEDPGEL